MLRITDARTGEPTDATPARRGLTRVEAHVPRPDTTGLRVLLVADVLVRALEISGTPVWTVLTGTEGRAELRARATALGIRPFEDERDSGSGLGEAQVLRVCAPESGAADSAGVDDGAGRDETASGLRVEVAPADADSGVADDDERASALRLALLACPRREPLRLDEAALTDAEYTLRRWRGAVATWATRPSGPIPDPVRQQLRAAWEDDLDVPAVLAVLRKVETSGTVPDGARFETYAYADRLLGLELTRDIGRETLA
ncbi:hypothetical protein OHB35_42570 [Streptomyces phaeochromogenes]|uniref:Cysteinyl-tRNA synthetase n=1 Tax=Streptomyces phaeochromogenes TaxID=1923 RepID=A0ABZ1HPB4_STRPH|nr:hypothetical protein [Streptomyces phaeochromogenes]WSD19397.1 hypothetical protein OHB35_42570 [Streptomyces phaeochromogenes]